MSKIGNLMEEQSVPINFSSINSHPQRALSLIKIFMRFEFAMKENSFCRHMKRKKLEVCWDRFVKDALSEDFFSRIRESAMAKTLIEDPPSHQVFDGLGLSWKKATAPVQSCQDLFGAIRRVRNNLFHGGKSGDVDHDRNDKLIAEAEYVLIEALKESVDIRSAFEGKY